MSTTNTFLNNKNKLKISRRGRKLSLLNDSKIITVLPKEIPERMWSEILLKEENDFVIFDIREEIIENALKIGCYHYMEKQNVKFTVHCAIKAWLQIIDWYFFRHDPGEDVSASPACFIPKREASWQPDDPPEPSPRDSFCQQRLEILEDESRESLGAGSSSISLDYPIVEEIPREYWFPGRVNLKLQTDTQTSSDFASSQEYDSSGTTLTPNSEGELAAESEVLQNIIDYSNERMSKEEEATKVLGPRSERDKRDKKRASCAPEVALGKKLSRASRGSGAGGSGDASVKTFRALVKQPPTTRTKATNQKCHTVEKLYLKNTNFGLYI